MVRILLSLIAAAVMSVAVAAENFEYKIYFGLSKKDGAVSLAEWEAYEAGFAKAFAGFTVTAATGYYMGAKERTRVITLYMDDCKEPKLNALIRSYVQKFGQDSVLVAKNELESWQLIKKDSVESMNDACAATSDN